MTDVGRLLSKTGLFRDSRGTCAIEYGMLFSFLAALLVTTVSAFGSTMSETVGDLSHQITCVSHTASTPGPLSDCPRASGH